MELRCMEVREIRFVKLARRAHLAYISLLDFFNQLVDMVLARLVLIVTVESHYSTCILLVNRTRAA